MQKNERAIEIGKRLRKLRDIRPKTKVAEKMGISYSALCKYEAGIRMPTDEQKKKIAEFYGVSEEEIFFA